MKHPIVKCYSKVPQYDIFVSTQYWGGVKAELVIGITYKSIVILASMLMYSHPLTEPFKNRRTDEGASDIVVFNLHLQFNLRRSLFN